MIHVMIMILIIRILTISLHCQTSYTNVCFDFREWGYVWKTAFEQLVFAQRDAFYKSMMCSNRTRHILCIYIYIYRERERDVWMYMCISHVHVHIYIYIYSCRTKTVPPPRLLLLLRAIVVIMYLSIVSLLLFTTSYEAIGLCIVYCLLLAHFE